MNNSKIIELPEDLANMIAAGEVVERPSSVVKELVENSLDAESSIIKIDLINAGLTKITISDNGIGMTKDDISMAIKPHATSKIKNKNDLFMIKTLGFRGEALPSIASVSKMKITSSTDGLNGYFQYFEGTKLVSENQVAYPKGTKIEVSDLFYNTPARFKHLSSESVELSHIVQLINKFSLGYPKVAFTLTNNNKILYATDGSNDLKMVINEIFGLEVVKLMLPFAGKSSLYEISGYTSTNSVFRASKNGLILLINHRIIKNNNLNYAILDAYKTYLPVGKYPITILEITANPSYVDVNVHPTKQEVRFTDEKELRDLITRTINQTLKDVELVYEISSSKDLLEDTFNKNDTEKKILNQATPQVKDAFTSWESIPFSQALRKDEKVNHHLFDVSSAYRAGQNDENLTNFNIPNNDHHLLEEEFSYDAIYHATKSKTDKKPEQQTIIFNKRTDHNFFKSLTYIGQFNLTYLVFEKEGNLYLLDQHAGMERVMYEKISNSFKKPTSEYFELLVPLTINITKSDEILLSLHSDDLNKLGISYELENTKESAKNLIIKTIPTWIPKGYEQEFITEIIESLFNNQEVSKALFYDELAKKLSCKKSIKANMHILKEEVIALLNSLDECENPFTCPHGRPTIIHFSNYEIEKLFKRVI